MAASKRLFNVDQGFGNPFGEHLACWAGTDVLVITLGKPRASTGALPEGQGLDMYCRVVAHKLMYFPSSRGRVCPRQ